MCNMRWGSVGGMAKPKSQNPDPIRLHVLLTPKEAEELDDWQFEHRHRTRTAALKAMMRIAMEAMPVPAAPKPAKPRGRR